MSSPRPHPRLNLKRSRSSVSSSSAYDRQPILLAAAAAARAKLEEGHGRGGGPDLDDMLVGAEIQMTAAVSGVVPDDTFTVSQAVNALGFGKFQIILSFVTGLCWMADSMEVMILSVLSPALHCHWGVGQYQQALLTTVVFVGMMTSSVFWGKLADKYGRRQALLLSGSFLFFYGMLSAFSPNYEWVLFLRFLVGFTIGCVPQSVTLFSEFLPSKQRAKCVVLLDCFWALGACLEVLLASLVMPSSSSHGWRWLLALSALPSLTLVALSAWWPAPESARFNMSAGRTDAALETLERVARENGAPMILGRLTVDDGDGAYGNSTADRGRVSSLLGRDLFRTTVSLWFVWSTAAFLYYGVVLMTTELFETPGDHICALDGSLTHTCSAQCSPLDRVDYGNLLWTTLAEFPGILVTLAVIERLGRRRTLALEFALSFLSLLVLLDCSSARWLVTAALFTARACASGVFQALYVYTPEAHPTPMRATALGACAAASRAGAVVTPYVAQVLLKHSVSAAVGVYAAVSAAAVAVCLLLPVETKGKDLDGK